MRRAALVAAALVAVACSSSNTATSGSGSTSGAGSQFASQICAKIATCTTAPSDCEAAFAAVVFSVSCQDELIAASCTDLLANPVPQSLTNCIPTCTASGSCGNASSASCNGDGTITECINGDQFVYSCQGVCAAESKTYVGTCASTYQGTASPTGCDTCWCQ